MHSLFWYLEIEFFAGWMSTIITNTLDLIFKQNIYSSNYVWFTISARVFCGKTLPWVLLPCWYKKPCSCFHKRVLMWLDPDGVPVNLKDVGWGWGQGFVQASQVLPHQTGNIVFFLWTRLCWWGCTDMLKQERVFPKLLPLSWKHLNAMVIIIWY